MRSLAWLLLLGTTLALAPGVVFAQKKPFDAEALLRIQRIADPQLSPDGKTVAFAVSVPDVAENKSLHSVWSVPLEGGEPPQAGGPRRPPALVARRQTDLLCFEHQRCVADLEHESGWHRHRAGDASCLRKPMAKSFPADGKYIVVTSRVYPECSTASGQFDDACNKKHLDAESQSKVKARLITGLLFRHWNEWEGNRRSHLLSISLADGKVADLSSGTGIPGLREVPPFSLGGPDDYAISPGRHRSLLRDEHRRRARGRDE